MPYLIRLLAFSTLLTGVFSIPAGAEVVRLHGSQVGARVIAAAGPLLREKAIDVKVGTEGGSSGGIQAATSGMADIAMTTRPLKAADRAQHPDKRLEEVVIGYQCLAFIVAEDVWAGGVRALSKEQLLGIYEGTTRNWKEVGGADRPIKFYSPEPNKPTWDFFVTYLYGDIRKAPLGSFEVVTGGQEARDSVEFNAGSASVASPSWANARGVYALGVKENGTVLEPSAENVRTGTYPLVRPVLLITAATPGGDVRRLLEIMLSPPGQEAVRKSDLLPATAAAPPAR